MRVRISLLPTGARSLPRVRPRRLGGATWTRMMTWTSTTQRSPHPRTHRGDPAETHRDPLVEARQDPLEDAHQVDPPEGGPPGRGGPHGPGGPGGGPPAGPPGDPDAPPGNGDPDATWQWIVKLCRRVQSLEREVDTGRGEMTASPGLLRAHRKSWTSPRRRWSRLPRSPPPPKGAGPRQGPDQAAEQGHQRRAAEVGPAGRPWERRQRPPTPGVWLVGRRLGTRTRSRQTPRPWQSPQESPQRQCPFSQRPLSTQRGPPQRARAARQWQ